MPIHGYPGNVITANPTAPTSSVATGVWTTEQQLIAKAAGNWPTTIPAQQISRSLRFNPADTAYLNRTLGSSNRRTFTFSAWVKRSLLASDQHLLGCINFAGGGSTNQQFGIVLQGGDYLNVFHYNNGTYQYYPTAALYRDVSAWYHFVVAVDTTQATGSNRAKIYVNGVLQATNGAVDFTQNTDLFINSGLNTGIGTQVGTGTGNSYFFGGYMAEVYFIDGQQLTPSSFGQTNASTGVWEPIAYSGTYGTNGFYLNFSDNSNTTAATLGKDYSGNGNNWTPNNFSVTAGSGNDSMVDSPTAYGTDTGVGGEVRGNYCTWNSAGQYTLVNGSVTRSNGNLESTDGGSTYGLASFGTIAVTTGKWYWEVTLSSAGGTYASTGVVDLNSPLGSNIQTGIIYGANSGNKGSGYQVFSGSGSTAYGATYTTGDIIGVALNLDAGTITFYKNGVSQGVAFTGISGNYTPAVGDGQNSTSYTWTLNCGQRPFAYTAPSGFKALCTQNLPTPTIGATSTTQANDYFNVVLYSGNSSTQNITGVGFAPDFTWLKVRNDAQNHRLFDTVRGANKRIMSSSTAAEATTTDELTAFGSDGFTLGANTDVNGTGFTYVSWNWNAGGSTVTNTSGTISAQVRANTTSGFSIVTYTGTGSNATVGHGLGVAPAMYIVKRRTGGVGNWAVWHTKLSNTTTSYILLDSTAAQSTSTSLWGSTAATSTTLGLGTSVTTNNSSDTYVAYCFAAVAGYSAFGSYTGNGSADGPFVYTGFRPEFFMTKRTDGLGDNWHIHDTTRSPYNIAYADLRPNTSDAENTSAYPMDILSNGIKWRQGGADGNESGASYIFVAFAESPFKYALAR